MPADGHTGEFRERTEALLRGGASGFPLASRHDLSGFESTCGLAQGPPLCSRVSFSQRWIPERGSPGS